MFERILTTSILIAETGILSHHRRRAGYSTFRRHLLPMVIDRNYDKAWDEATNAENI